MLTTGAAHPDAVKSPRAAAATTPTSIPRSTAEHEPARSRTPPSLAPFFLLAGACAPFAKLLRPVACTVIPWVAPGVLAAINKNAARIFGREFDRGEGRRFAARVIGSFYDFVLDVGRSSRMSPHELACLVESVEGLDAYRASRAGGKGAILVTAHLGTFEAGLAALTREERSVRVVFKRDSVPAYERLRSRLHEALGVIETPIDDGLTTWLALREALLADGVIVMQGDRAVPGQKSQVVPFLHGHVCLPTGPVRLAQLTGAPIIPVFAMPTRAGRYRVLLKPAIHVATNDDQSAGMAPAAALRAMADAIAEVVAEHPHQWLALEAVFQEDRDDAKR